MFTLLSVSFLSQMYINTCTISQDNQFADLNDYNIEI